VLALVTVIVYLCVLIAVGVVKSRSVRDQAGFSLAGRGLSPLVLVGTLLATWTGTGSIFGNAEEGFRVGLPALLLPLSSAAGVLVLLALAPRVRAKGRYTLQDVLEERFGPMARVLGSLTLVSAYLVIVSYQIRAASAVLDRVAVEAGVLDAASAGVTSMVVVTIFIGVYTALAGLMSVAFTDGVNGVLMLLGIGLALPLAISAAGGFDGVRAALPEGGGSVTGFYSGFDLASRLLPAFLLVIGDANLHQRMLSARSDRAARTATLLLIPGILLVDGLILAVAFCGRALVPGIDNPGHVVLELSMSVLPAAAGALLVAAILAIVVSTADSFLLSSSTSIVRDVYQRFVRRNASEKELVRTARIVVLGLSAAALGLAFTSDAFFSVALFAYTIYGVGITPPLLAALFWKRATPAGAISSMLAATTLAIAWKANDWSAPAAEWLGQPAGTSVDAVVPSIVVACVVLVGVSLMTTPRPVAEPTSG
jgi:SSS family transporter